MKVRHCYNIAWKVSLRGEQQLFNCADRAVLVESIQGASLSLCWQSIAQLASDLACTTRFAMT